MNAKAIVLGLGAALVLAILISPFASSWPDGLEKVAEQKGFLHKGERPPALPAPVPDYAWPGVKREGIATAAAGAMGTIVVFGIAWGMGALLKGEER
jgi:cobalt/nickel transport protein